MLWLRLIPARAAFLSGTHALNFFGLVILHNKVDELAAVRFG